jgi:hypothetical protein
MDTTGQAPQPLQNLSPFGLSHTYKRYDDALPSYRASFQGGTSLDITQRIERKLAQYNASQSTLKRWLFEILSVTTSAVCIGTSTHGFFIRTTD